MILITRYKITKISSAHKTCLFNVPSNEWRNVSLFIWTFWFVVCFWYVYKHVTEDTTHGL